MEVFIRNKYAVRLWAQEGATWPPAPTATPVLSDNRSPLEAGGLGEDRRRTSLSVTSPPLVLPVEGARAVLHAAQAGPRLSPALSSSSALNQSPAVVSSPPAESASRAGPGPSPGPGYVAVGNLLTMFEEEDEEGDNDLEGGLMNT